MTRCRWFMYLIVVWSTSAVARSDSPSFEVGVAARDITPSLPVDVFLSRVDKVAAPLYAKAVAFKDQPGARVVLVSVDTPLMTRDFVRPLVKEISEPLALDPSHLILISTHTHTAPYIPGTQYGLQYGLTVAPGYLDFLRQKIAEVVRAALNDMQPVELNYGVGRATFAMNRRAFTASGTAKMLPNPDGPVDWDVPVLEARGADGRIRAILFGYACHAVAGDADGLSLSPDYPGYAEHELEVAFPGSVAIYFPGFGGDQNPYPRMGDTVTTPADEPWAHADVNRNARQPFARPHGLELAGAVAGVMARPMQTIQGSLDLAYRDVNLRLSAPPTRRKLEADARDPSIAVKDLGESPTPPPDDAHVDAANALLEGMMKRRAEKYLSFLNRQEPLPESTGLPLAALRLGNLTVLFMGGEPVVDYALRFKRLLGFERTWLVGYAYELHFYVPTARLLKEGGYEPDWAMAELGFYGRFDPSIENTIVDAMLRLVASVRKE